MRIHWISNYKFTNLCNTMLFSFFLQCVPIMGLGFRRGSYRCVCKDGFYFPNVTSPHKYYNGTVLEEEYEKKFDSVSLSFLILSYFPCLFPLSPRLHKQSRRSALRTFYNNTQSHVQQQTDVHQIILLCLCSTLHSYQENE